MDNYYDDSIKGVLESEEHTELIDGQFVIQNMTTISHNRAVSEMVTALKNYIREHNGECEVFSENVALHIGELCDEAKDMFLPDVMVVCEADGIKEDGVHVSPLFVAEVTSESTKKNDYGRKLEIYRKIGVGEYWIVDIQRNVIFKYLKEDDYIPQTFIYPESMKVSVIPGMMMDASGFVR